MATHCSTLAWRIPWTEEPGGLLSMGLHRVGHDWSDLVCMHACSIYRSYHYVTRLVYPDVPERPVRNNGGEDFSPFTLKCCSQLEIFLPFLSNLCPGRCTQLLWESSIPLLPSPPTTLVRTNFPDLLILLSGWSKPPIILFCSIKDICFPRHICVHTKKSRIMS